jgi:hypothetical protein
MRSGSLAGIHARFARLLRNQCKSSGQTSVNRALYHAERALELLPDDAILRLMVAKLALAQMKWDAS